MNKLKLDIETLAVETFATGDEFAANGTVLGHVRELPTNSENNQMTCGQQTCFGFSCYTCSICLTFDYMCQQQEEEFVVAD